MDPKAIILIVVIIILVVIVAGYVSKDVNTLTDLLDGKTMTEIKSEDLTTSDTNATNFTYSIWFYIEDWNYKYGKPKIIFARMGVDPSNPKKKAPCPAVALGPIQNNIVISLTVYPGQDELSADGESESGSGRTIKHECGVENIPIQKWVNLFVSVYGRTMDIYIDGKLVRTCLLPGVAKVDSTAPVYITPTGGFSGWTSRFQYWPEASDPQKAWDIYKKGYGGSLLGSLFGKYTVNISLMEGDTEVKSVTF